MKTKPTFRDWALFLDDDRSPRAFPWGEPALMRTDMPVIWCRTNEEALTYVRWYGPPKVMYLDYNLDPGTTMETLMTTREYFPNNPPHTVVFMTGDWEGERSMREFIANWRKVST